MTQLRMVRIPDFKYGEIPIWHHHHSHKVEVFRVLYGKKILLLRASAVDVGIEAQLNGWRVSWIIRHCDSGQCRGCALFNDTELASAFGLSDKSGEFGGWLLDRYGGDCAEQGKYIRYKNFLNIPGPGTGNDGDSNVSIDVDNHIREAVAGLLMAAAGFRI